jgi:hypothetical protein
MVFAFMIERGYYRPFDAMYKGLQGLAAPGALTDCTDQDRYAAGGEIGEIGRCCLPLP